MFFRRQQPKQVTFADLLQRVRAAGFDVETQPNGSARVARAGCAALLTEGPGIAHAGWVVAGQTASLIDGGYQKFWQTADRRIPALATQLQALHEFEEDLREALRLESWYNTSLGTTNDLHNYDRLTGRE